MLKADYPIYFDDTEISIKPRQWNRAYAKIENVNRTEDGKDDVEVVRSRKSTISCQFRCTDSWVSVLSSFQELPSFVVRFYDTKTKTYIELDVRMSNYSEQLILGSERLGSTNGVWNVGFNLVEF